MALIISAVLFGFFVKYGDWYFLVSSGLYMIACEINSIRFIIKKLIAKYDAVESLEDKESIKKV